MDQPRSSANNSQPSAGRGWVQQRLREALGEETPQEAAGKTTAEVPVGDDRGWAAGLPETDEPGLTFDDEQDAATEEIQPEITEEPEVEQAASALAYPAAQPLQSQDAAPLDNHSPELFTGAPDSSAPLTKRRRPNNARAVKRRWATSTVVSSALGIVLVLVAALVVHNLYAFLIVSGNSMEPTLRDGQAVLLHKHDSWNRGDLLVFRESQSWIDTTGDTNKPGTPFVKRILAVPGDNISFDGVSFTVNGNTSYPVPASYQCAVPAGSRGPYTLKSDDLFVGGDNVLHSLDSRRVYCTHGDFATSMVHTNRVIKHGSLFLSN